MSKFRVLVTGGAGYIGSHTVKSLLASGYDVTVFDNFSTGRKENLFSEAKLVEGNILNASDLKIAFKEKIDAVIHFAASKAAGESMIYPRKYSENNIIGSFKLINAVVENNVQNFILSSTAAVYGDPVYLPIDEQHPLNPSNYYGYTKLAIEQNLNWFSKLGKLNFACLRYFNAAGYDIDNEIKGLEINPANLFPVVFETALGIRESMTVHGTDYDTFDGTCIRDYIHVSDLANGHIKALEHLISKQENLTLNLGSGDGFSVLEVINAFEKLSGKKLNYKLGGRRYGDPSIVKASSALAKELIGFETKYSDLETIIKTMLNVYFG